MVVGSLTDEAADGLFHALADATRRDIVRRSVAGELSVSRLAEIAGTSERTLYEGFRAFLDVSPQQYVINRRLKAAREMLLTGNQPVATVARLCGFKHLSRFAKTYRERYLEYPSETAKL